MTFITFTLGGFFLGLSFEHHLQTMAYAKPKAVKGNTHKSEKKPSISYHKFIYLITKLFLSTQPSLS